MKRWFYLVFLVFLLFGCGSGGSDDVVNDVNRDSNGSVIVSNFRNVGLEWDANTESNLAGYRVFIRVAGQDYDYSNPEWETIDTDCMFYNLNKDITYYFVVRAFNTEDNESDDSNEATLDRL